MNEGRTAFSQLMDFVPKSTFRGRVQRYQGDQGVERFTCWQQWLAMSFAQLAFRRSLRDIDACLSVAPEKLYHMGFTGSVARSTLADANEKRDWRIYADFAHVLIGHARKLYAVERADLEHDTRLDYAAEEAQRHQVHGVRGQTARPAIAVHAAQANADLTWIVEHLDDIPL